MDILEAVKAMRDGKAVRRCTTRLERWRIERPAGYGRETVRHWLDEDDTLPDDLDAWNKYFSLADLDAEWEVAP